MNRKEVLAFLIVLMGILILGGCAGMIQRPVTHTEFKPDQFGKEFSPEELRADLKMMIETLEDVHPNLYAYTPKAKIDSLRHSIEEKLARPLTRTEFYFRIAPLVAEIGDGHTSLSPPMEEYARFRMQGGLAFPFNAEYDTLTGLTITRNYSDDSTITLGDRIVSINGCSADSLSAVFLRGFSGERLAFREHSVGNWLRALIWLKNILPPYDLVFQPQGSREGVERHIAGVTQQAIRYSDSLLAKRAAVLPNYRFERLPDSIGYIDFRSMVNAGEFGKFLSTTFADIQSNPVRGIIVDLRNNGGGSSQLGSDLLSYLTDSSYRMAARKEWKMSAQYKSYLLGHIPWWIRWFPITWVNGEAKRHLGAHDGDIVVDSATAEPPPPNPPRYHGKTCFLIGTRTFSSAMMLANAVADYKLATLIGEETGGIPTAYGEVYSFDLPRTKLSMGVSSAHFVRANGNETDKRGILPDIEIRQTDEDARIGTDTALERARQWVLKGG